MYFSYNLVLQKVILIFEKTATKTWCYFINTTPLHCPVVSQHKLFNEHLVSASGNPSLVIRRKKHTEKEVHAHLISVVSVRLREGYTIREISLTKGQLLFRDRQSERKKTFLSLNFLIFLFFLLRWDSAGGETGSPLETQHAHRILGGCRLAAGPCQEDHQGGGDHGGELWHPAWHQLHSKEAHHQPVPHYCHPTFLEHAAEVQQHVI